MELRQLEAFAAVMSVGSVTAAGVLLGRSQPAISRLIQELEAEIGYALFLRSGPRVTPTDQGFLLYEDVERALVGLQQIRDRAKDIALGQARPLRIAATSALSVGLLPAALKHLQTQLDPSPSPSPIQLRSASPEHVVHAVLTGAVQIGVTSLPLEHRGLQVLWIGQAPCVVALPDHDPLADQPVVTLSSLRERPFVTLSNPYRLRHRLNQVLDIPKKNLIETNSSINALAAVRNGLGVAVLEPVSAYGAPLQGVQIRPLDVCIPFYFGVITPGSQAPAPPILALSQALAHMAARLPGFVLHDPAEHAALLRLTCQDQDPISSETSPL